VSARSYYDGGSLHIDSYDSIYDPLPAALSGDVEFYAALARRSGAPVLEIGCGTGHVALALAAAGLDVVGLDLAPDMLAAAAAKLARLPPAIRARVALHRGDMRGFQLGALFGTIIVPFRTFHLLLSEDDQRRCLAAIRRHLRPHGRLALHLFDPPTDIAARAGNTVLASERGVSRGSGRQIVAESGDCTIDTAQQVRREIWHYRELDARGRKVREQDLELAVRWVRRPQMHALLEHAGFVIEAELGDFRGGQPFPGSEQIWIAARG
jgi:SAM-dependent methyltransferase